MMLRSALRGTVEHLTWRVLGGALAIAVALDVWSVFDVSLRSTDRFTRAAYLSETMINSLVVLMIMFTTRVADELVAMGARRVLSYPLAVLTGSVVGALAQGLVYQWQQFAGAPAKTLVAQSLVAFSEYVTWGSILVFIYVNRRNALRAGARLASAQLQRAETRRRALESRLRALQARVEPQFLYSSLAQVRDLYESDPVKGGQVFGELIAYLRAALPHLREPASSLRHELDLGTAYLNVMRARAGERLALAVEVTDAASAARMPAMVLLPLINHSLLHRQTPLFGADTIHIGACRADGKLQVTIAHSGKHAAPAGNGSDLGDVEQRLHALYGAKWKLAIEPSGDDGTRMVMEIPYEPADSRHR